MIYEKPLPKLLMSVDCIWVSGYREALAGRNTSSSMDPNAEAAKVQGCVMEGGDDDSDRDEENIRLILTSWWLHSVTVSSDRE